MGKLRDELKNHINTIQELLNKHQDDESLIEEIKGHAGLPTSTIRLSPYDLGYSPGVTIAGTISSLTETGLIARPATGKQPLAGVRGTVGIVENTMASIGPIGGAFIIGTAVIGGLVYLLSRSDDWEDDKPSHTNKPISMKPE